MLIFIAEAVNVSADLWRFKYIYMLIFIETVGAVYIDLPLFKYIYMLIFIVAQLLGIATLEPIQIHLHVNLYLGHATDRNQTK